MYSAQQFLKAVQDPSLIQAEARGIYNQVYDSIVNRIMERDQRNETSRYGLVLNWGLYRRDAWTVAEYPYFINKFIDRFDPIIITSQALYDKKASEMDNIFAFDPKSDKGLRLDYSDEDHTTLLFGSDPNQETEWFYKYIQQNNIDYVLSPVYNPFFEWMPRLEEKKLKFFPWAVPEEFIIQPDEIRFRGNEKIHLTGASGSEIYEMRDWCRQQNNVIDYNNSGHQNRVYEHDEYYRWLRNFDCMIAAGSLHPKWHYLFGKYFEIPAAGTLLFAQYSDDLHKAGFTEKNCVIFKSKKEFISKSKEYMRNREEYIETRKRGVELIRENHTVSDRVDTVEHLFN